MFQAGKFIVNSVAKRRYRGYKLGSRTLLHICFTPLSSLLAKLP